MILNASQQDVLTEFANIGISRGAKQLSILLNDTIRITMPEVHLAPATDLHRYMVHRDEIDCIVYQDIAGAFMGRAHLVFGLAESKTLVKALLDSLPNLAHEDLSSYEHEALSEIGNIIITAAMITLGDLIKKPLLFTPPVYTEQRLEGFIQQAANVDDETQHILVMKAELRAVEKSIDGMLFICLTLDAIKNIISSIDQLLTSPAR